MRPVTDRERRLTRLAYRALAIGFNKAHLGERWMRHFGERANRLFDAALKEWRDA